jgi:hypothetical protein
MLKLNYWNADVFHTAAIITTGHRLWFHDVWVERNLHPAVMELIEGGNRPTDWHQVLLEWPHVSDDGLRLAYIRSERDGEQTPARRTVTTLGRYIMRNFTLPDHTIRDIVARHSTPPNSIKLVETVVEFIYHIDRGPYSCMKRDENYRPEAHPYNAYSPELGWKLAVREENGDTVGRALVNTDKHGQKYWVRSYKKDPHNGYSYADEKLEAWLIDKGYEKRSEYPVGTNLSFVPDKHNNCGFIAPYIDGDEKHIAVNWFNSKQVLTIVHDTSDATWLLDNTGGDADDVSGEACSDCNDRVRDGDQHWVGMNEDTMVCDSCLSNNYYYVYGRRGNQYYLHSDDMIHVDGECYDSNYLSDNDIVELQDGEHCSMDDAVCTERYSRWFKCDDEDVCELEDNGGWEETRYCRSLEDGGWCLKDDAWQCAISGNWYSENNDTDTDGRFAAPDGTFVHEDYVEQMADEDNEIADAVKEEI